MTATEFESRLMALEQEVATLEAKYYSLEEQLEYARTVAGIKRGLEEADRGLGIPLKQADEQLRAKYSIPRS